MASDFLSIIEPATALSRTSAANPQQGTGPASSAGAGYGAVSPCRAAADRRPGKLDPTDSIPGRARRPSWWSRSATRAWTAPQPSDLYSVGTLATVHKVVKMPNQSLFVFTEGTERVKLGEFAQIEPFMMAAVEPVAGGRRRRKSAELEALQRNVICAVPADRHHLADAFRRAADHCARISKIRAGWSISSLPRCRSWPRPTSRNCWKRPMWWLRMERINKHLAKEARGPAAAQQDPDRSAGPGAAIAARLLPARTAEGHPEGTRRDGRGPEGHRGAARRRSKPPACRRT